MELLLVLYCLSAYFLPLMHALRTHITKLFLIPLVIVGLSMYVVRPAYAQADRSFAFWLSSVVDQNVSPDLQKEADRLKLRAPGSDMFEMMQQVSELLSRTGTEASSADAPEVPLQIYKVLLQQWDHFQHSKGMAATPPLEVEVRKPLLSSQVDKFQSGTDLRLQTTLSGYPDVLEKIYSFKGKGFNTKVRPMVTGIAIGAP